MAIRRTWLSMRTRGISGSFFRKHTGWGKKFVKSVGNFIGLNTGDGPLLAISGFTGLNRCFEPVFARFNGTDNYLASAPFSADSHADEGTVILWSIPTNLGGGNIWLYDIGNGVTASDFTTRQRIQTNADPALANFRVVLGDPAYNIVADVNGLLQGAGAGQWQFDVPNIFYLTYKNDNIDGVGQSKIQIGINGTIVFDDTFENAGGGDGTKQIGFSLGDRVTIGARHNLTGALYQDDISEIFSARKFLDHDTYIDQFLNPETSANFPNGTPVGRVTGSPVGGANPSNHFGGFGYTLANWNSGDDGTGNPYTLNGADLTSVGLDSGFYVANFSQPVVFANHTGVTFIKNLVAETLSTELTPDPNLTVDAPPNNQDSLGWIDSFGGVTVSGGALTVPNGAIAQTIATINPPNTGEYVLDLNVLEIGTAGFTVNIDGADAIIINPPLGESEVRITPVNQSDSGFITITTLNANESVKLSRAGFKHVEIAATSEQTLAATSSTVSPATKIVYDEPVWTVALITGDTVHWNYDGTGSYKKAYAAAQSGATGQSNCTVITAGIIEVTYKDLVSWTDQTGIAFFNVTTSETSGQPTGTQETSPSKVVTYTGVSWVTEPAAGQIIQLVISEPNTYLDISFMDAQTLEIQNCANLSLNTLHTVKSLSYEGTKWDKQLNTNTRDEDLSGWVLSGNLSFSGPTNGTCLATGAVVGDRSYLRDTYTIPANRWMVATVDAVSSFTDNGSDIIHFITVVGLAGVVTGSDTYRLPSGTTNQRVGIMFRTDTLSTVTMRAGIGANNTPSFAGNVTFENFQIQDVEDFAGNLFDDYSGGKPITLPNYPGNKLAGAGATEGNVTPGTGEAIYSGASKPYALIMGTGDSFANDNDEWISLTSDMMSPGSMMGRGYSSQSLTGVIGAEFAGNLATANYTGVVIQGGINDVIANVLAPAMQTALEGMVTTAVGQGLDITIINVSGFLNNAGWTTARQTEIDAYNASSLAFANANGYKYIDMYDLLGDAGDKRALAAAYDSGDGLHPNTAGSQVVADAIIASQT